MPNTTRPVRPGAESASSLQTTSPEHVTAPAADGAPVFASRRERREYEAAMAQAPAAEPSVDEPSIAEPSVAEQDSTSTAPAAQPAASEPTTTAPELHPVPAEADVTVPSPDTATVQAIEAASHDTLGYAAAFEPHETLESLDTLALVEQPAITGTPSDTLDVPARSRRHADVARRSTGSRRAAVARTAAQSAAHRPGRLARLVSGSTKGFIMLAAAALTATVALPAYARVDTQSVAEITQGVRTQTLDVGAGVTASSMTRDSYSAAVDSSVLVSTTSRTVAPEVQALAQQLMQAVAEGRLIGTTPDHIKEIRWLAEGQVVSNCGIDYRVLETIGFALTQFNQVGVSDINRRCTGQIEGAGTASAHYADGGGHAVDFFQLNGHALSGGDPDSMKLIEALDPIVPAKTNVGQAGCRASIALKHFNEIPDTCNHLHIDFGSAGDAGLKLSS